MTRREDLRLVEAVAAGDAKAWDRFVERTADTVHAAAAAVFPAPRADAEALALYRQLQINDFAALRDYDGRSTLATFLSLRLAELMIERILALLIDDAEHGWAAFQAFYSDEIRRIVGRRFAAAPGGALDDGSGMEDKLQDVLERLVADDYRRLRSYDGKGSFTGFVRATVRNICADLGRAMLGRRRLPAAIEKLDPVHHTIFKEIYWNGVGREDLPRLLRDGDGRALEAVAVEAALARVDQAAGAGAFVAVRATARNTVRLDGENAHARATANRLADGGASPEEAVLLTEHEAELDKLTGALGTAMASLPAEARLYLQYRFLEEPPLAPRQIAPLMNLPVAEIYRRRKAWEAALKTELKAQGVENLAVLSV